MKEIDCLNEINILEDFIFKRYIDYCLKKISYKSYKKFLKYVSFDMHRKFKKYFES